MSEMPRRQFIRLAAGSAIAVTTLGVAACGSGEEGGATTGGTAGGGGGGGRIGFAFSDTKVDVFKPLMAGAEEEAKRRGYEVLVSSPSGRAEAQIADLNTWIGQGVEALVILPLDPNAIAGVARRAQDRGIVVVGYSDHIPGEDGYDVFNHRQGAQIVGEYAAQWIRENLEGKAQVAVLAFDQVEVGRQRIDGALAAIEAAGVDANVVARQEAADAATGLTTMQSILQAHPDTNVVIGVNDDVILGASQAFAAAKKPKDEIFIAGFDGNRQAMQRILDGDYIKATGALPLKRIGEAIVWIPANILEDRRPTNYTADYELVTTETPDLARALIADYGG
jgi:ribose transport system substrate-binding protein